MPKRRLLLLGAALLVVLAACGGDDAVDTTATAAAPATTVATATTQPAETTTTVAETTTTTTIAETTTTSGGGGEPSALQDALLETAEVTSGRMEGSFVMEGIEGLPGGIEISMPFAGAFDNAKQTFEFSLDMSGFAAALGEEMPPGFEDAFGVMEIRQIGDVAYMRFPLFSLFLGPDVEWIEIPAEEASSTAGGFGAATPANPSDFLAAFEEADADIVEIGPEQVRGIDTMRYLVTFDMEKLLEQATPEERAELEAQGPLPFDELPMDLWIGADDGLIYKYVMDIDGATVPAAPGEGFDRMVMTFEMYDYGADIVVEAPPADQITPGDALGDFFNF